MRRAPGTLAPWLLLLLTAVHLSCDYNYNCDYNLQLELQLQLQLQLQLIPWPSLPFFFYGNLSSLSFP